MRRSVEKGQVLMEFVVCIVPIIFVFSGLILMAVLGRANVQNTIQTRSAVDLGNNPGKAKVEEILTWDYGKDQVPFTSDDRSKSGARSYYSAEDMDTEKYTVAQTFDTNFNLREAYDAGHTLQMPGKTSFTAAADLVGAEISVDDVLSAKQMHFFSRLFQIYLKSFHLNIKDTAFMPKTKDSRYEVKAD